jgi:hypothetical protein
VIRVSQSARRKIEAIVEFGHTRKINDWRFALAEFATFKRSRKARVRK